MRIYVLVELLVRLHTAVTVCVMLLHGASAHSHVLHFAARLYITIVLSPPAAREEMR